MVAARGGAFVTILFTDLVGSAALFARHGDEAADAVRREHFAALRAAVAEHGGREVRSTGDGLMVAFASAVAAVRCAVDMQRATAAPPAGSSCSVGLDAGEPLADGDDLYGTPVIVAEPPVRRRRRRARSSPPRSSAGSRGPRVGRADRAASARCGCAASPSAWRPPQVRWREDDRARAPPAAGRRRARSAS